VLRPSGKSYKPSPTRFRREGEITPFAVKCLFKSAGLAGFRQQQDNAVGREEKEIQLP